MFFSYYSMNVSRTYLFLSLMSITSITVFMLPLFFIFLPIVSSFYIYLFIAFQFIFLYFPLYPPPHTSPLYSLIFSLWSSLIKLIVSWVYFYFNSWQIVRTRMSSDWEYFPSAGQFCYSFLYISQYRIYQCLFQLSSLNELRFPKPAVYMKFSDWREARWPSRPYYSPLAALELGLPKWL